MHGSVRRKQDSKEQKLKNIVDNESFEVFELQFAACKTSIFHLAPDLMFLFRLRFKCVTENKLTDVLVLQ